MTESSQLSEEERKKALYRYELIKPFLQKEKSLQAICKEQNIRLRTVSQWISRYQKLGLAGLIKQRRKEDTVKRRSCSQELQQVIEELYLKHPDLRVTGIYRQIKEYAIKHNLKYPSYSTLINIVRCLRDDTKALAHKSSRPYKQ